MALIQGSTMTKVLRRIWQPGSHLIAFLSRWYSSLLLLIVRRNLTSSLSIYVRGINTMDQVHADSDPALVQGTVCLSLGPTGNRPSELSKTTST